MGTGDAAPKSIHTRTMEREVWGHEWWSANGEKIYYQLHTAPEFVGSFVASYDVKSGNRTWLHWDSTQVAIHHNSSLDDAVFCGDGNKDNPWVTLLRPVSIPDRKSLNRSTTPLIKTGYFKSERLVNLKKHNYRLEPNAFFTPDKKFIIFRSNMLGPDHIFAVEVPRG